MTQPIVPHQSRRPQATAPLSSPAAGAHTPAQTPPPGETRPLWPRAAGCRMPNALKPSHVERSCPCPPCAAHPPWCTGCYIVRVAEFNGRSSRPPILLFLYSFSLRCGSGSVPCPDFLLRQFHQVPHEFVEIER